MKCIFCGSANKLVSTNDKSICKSCIVTSYFLSQVNISEDKDRIKKFKIETPKYYKSILDEYVIGQDNAKNVLSVAMFNHMTRINNLRSPMLKSNIILRGNSGQGKTLLVETLANTLDIPFAIINTSSLTSSGYSGEDVSSIIERLIDKANGNIKLAEKGIIFLDEIDKITSSFGSGKDVSGKAVQQELLKYIEGDKVTIYLNKTSTYEGDKVLVDTTNILFIGAGAFPNINKKVNSISVPNTNSNKTKESFLTKLELYGFIPEFLGRFSNIVELENLTEKQYKKILLEPKNNIIEKFNNMLLPHNITLSIEDSIIDEIIDRSMNNKIGARSLQKNLDELFNDFLLNIDLYLDNSYSVSFDGNIKFRKIKSNIQE